MNTNKWVWIFHKTNAPLASAVFSDLEKAELWIYKHKLAGILTKMPIDIGGYEWCIENGEQILEHYHYEKGNK